MQASDLIGRIAVVMKTCGEEVLMSHLGVVLYEYLGEEYPEVLGSILGALKVCMLYAQVSFFLYIFFFLSPRIGGGDAWHDLFAEGGVGVCVEVVVAVLCNLASHLWRERLGSRAEMREEYRVVSHRLE